ncbi:MAG: NAD(P)-dependent oxidoreductase [Alphaproteobacteria bacterium]|nr:NAD(P)-dependent oxidoreductase [Alphaproteobacteria bacterium]
MRVVLTGASGFVGKAVLNALLRRGVVTIAVSRRRPQLAGDFDWYETDLLDPAATVATIRAARPDTVLHLAWNVEHGRFWTTPENLDWVAATLNLVRAAADQGANRFVGTGTCYEYDWSDIDDCLENVTPISPVSLYGVSKDATRRILEEFSRTNSVGFAWARLFFLYGPGEFRRRLVPTVAQALVANRVAKCTSGSGVRDFIDVREAGEALAALALSDVNGAVNIASGTAVKIADVANALGHLAGKAELVQVGALPDRPGEPVRVTADVSRLKHEVGYQTGKCLEEGLADALAYWNGIESGN